MSFLQTMGDYIEIEIHDASAQQKEMLIAQLADAGFEGFEEQQTLKAFIPQAAYDEMLVKPVVEQHKLTYSAVVVPQINWNATWEASFEPVVVEGFCTIRAAFHPPDAATQHEIIITPKMSFGTGHHATTFMMIAGMQLLDLNKKSVLDFGTGTGVLAILAEKTGALHIDAIDNDDWSIDNCRENIAMNACRYIRLTKQDSLVQCGLYDVILANINRQVIFTQLPAMKAHILPRGIVLLSGILMGDVDQVVLAAEAQGLQLESSTEKNSWVCLQLSAPLE